MNRLEQLDHEPHHRRRDRQHEQRENAAGPGVPAGRWRTTTAGRRRPAAARRTRGSPGGWVPISPALAVEPGLLALLRAAIVAVRHRWRPRPEPPPRLGCLLPLPPG